MITHRITRRTMLAGLAPLALPAAPRAYSPKLAVQTYVWTQYFRQQKKTPAEGAEEMFGSCHRAGFRLMELASFAGADFRQQAAAMAKKYDVQVPIVYAGGPMHETALAQKTVEQVLEVAGVAREQFGTRIIDTNPLPKPGRKSDDELKIQAEYLNRLGEDLRKRGMRLIVHHHSPEMAENAREWRQILKNTDPKLAGLCLDVDWIARGGQSQMAILKEAGTRVEAIHLRNSRQGVWTQELGDGEYDYPGVAAYLKEMGFSGYLTVELAWEKGTRNTRSLEENLRLSREYAERVFGLR